MDVHVKCGKSIHWVNHILLVCLQENNTATVMQKVSFLFVCDIRARRIEVVFRFNVLLTNFWLKRKEKKCALSPFKE